MGWAPRLTLSLHDLVQFLEYLHPTKLEPFLTEYEHIFFFSFHTSTSTSYFVSPELGRKMNRAGIGISRICVLHYSDVAACTTPGS
jgi:hypothetical protein